MSDETIKPIPVSELVEIPYYPTADIAHCVRKINTELIDARKSGLTTVSVEIYDEETIDGLLYEYSRIGYSVQWDKYTKKLILRWG